MLHPRIIARAWPLLLIPILGMITATYAIWQTDSGNLVTSLNSGWGDMVYHVRQVVFYAEQGMWPIQSALLAGESVGYPFFTNLLSSWLLKTGLSISSSMQLPTIVLAGLTLLAVELLTLHLTKSKSAAIIAALLFFTFAGLSGFVAVQDITGGESSWWNNLAQLPYTLTAWHDQDFVILNPFVMMLHQRGYLLGFPLLIAAIYAAARWLKQPTWQLLVSITIITSALAFIHPFSWVAWMMILPSWVAWYAILQKKSVPLRTSLGFLGTYAFAFLLGYLLIKYLQPDAGASSLQWLPGWLATDTSWFLFWIKNVGLYSVLGVLAFLHLSNKNATLSTLLLAGLTPFIIANFIQFTPWAWDNTKLIAPTWLILCIATATYLAELWHKKSLLSKASVPPLILILIFSGSLEITRVFAMQPEQLTISTPVDEIIGQTVQQHADKKDIVLFAPEPNHPAFLHGGRPALVAYEGWLWSQGWQGKYEQRLADVGNIYENRNSQQLIEHYDVAFVVVGPHERSRYQNLAIQPNWHLITEQAAYQLYNVRQ